MPEGRAQLLHCNMVRVAGIDPGKSQRWVQVPFFIDRL
jgi:hypothetical protein